MLELTGWVISVSKNAWFFNNNKRKKKSKCILVINLKTIKKKTSCNMNHPTFKSQVSFRCFMHLTVFVSNSNNELKLLFNSELHLQQSIGIIGSDPP